MLLKVTVEQNGVILSQSIAEIDDDESLSTAIKAAVDKVRAEDPSKPLWGLGIRVDRLSYGRHQPAPTTPTYSGPEGMRPDERRPAPTILAIATQPRG